MPGLNWPHPWSSANYEPDPDLTGRPMRWSGTGAVLPTAGSHAQHQAAVQLACRRTASPSGTLRIHPKARLLTRGMPKPWLPFCRPAWLRHGGEVSPRGGQVARPVAEDCLSGFFRGTG